MNKEMETVCTGIPKINQKQAEKAYRTSNQFFEDQIKFKEYMINKKEELRQKRLEISNLELQDRPAISKVDYDYLNKLKL